MKRNVKLMKSAACFMGKIVAVGKQPNVEAQSAFASSEGLSVGQVVIVLQKQTVLITK